MTCESARPLLSPLLDSQLPEPQAQGLVAHLGACPACSNALEGLRGASRLVRGLPRKPLPRGFLSKLALRRQRQAAWEGWPLAGPRAWAFAMSAILAGVVLYQTTRPRPPEIPIRAAAPPAPAPPKALPAAIKARGASPTNEMLQRMLQEESARLGIRSLGPQEAEELERPEPFLGTRSGPGTREQAEAVIRQFAAMRRAVDQAAGKPESVPIEGRTAQLLAQRAPQEGAALEPERLSQDAWAGLYSGGNEGARTILDPETWESLWRELFRDPAPKVDFKGQQVVAVFLGQRPSGGYSIEIVRVLPGEAYVSVEYRERTPPPGRTPPEGATSPFALKLIPKSTLPVRFTRLPPQP